MRAPEQKEYKKLYFPEFERAQNFLLPLYGGIISWSNADYEAFQYTNDGIRLIFYPHKTSAGNYHIRVRDGGSKNKVRAQAIIDVIQLDLSTDCTFQQAKNRCKCIYSDKQKNHVRNIAKEL
jgi:hypothetical protein